MLLPILAAAASLCFGRYAMAPLDLVDAIHDRIFGGMTVSPQITTVLWSMRLPRILLALLAGAGLSAAGCAFQSLFSNPLATPDTIGVASGASFGAALGLLLNFGLLGVQVVSLIFGLIALALTILAGSNKKRNNLNSIVLAGIMMGSLFSALVSLIKFSADPENQLPAITYWLMGSLDSAGYDSLLLGAPPILIGLAILLLLRWRLNLLPLSEDEARSTGVNITLLRGITIVCATMITASVVSMCGQVGWVGLLVPHMCRMKFGNNHTVLLPASILAGGAFLVIVDTVARSISAAEFPISILTAIIGAPFFIYLMRRTGGWQL
ncbi:FecCD family ABC transporter permease [Loigolactobacillus binensis]|uniref:FecCD family ABC transporter permease n=1 Tax=Loigolactobacillus binensis TaxID=2559922 RepID=A0ABW3E8A2_9LACO|nr:iron ABC transporter permease [Loigolactobacillus binensis]